MTNRAKIVACIALPFALLWLASYGGARNPSPTGSQGQKQNKSDIVYVCACLKTKSCSCMTVAKTEGPCACGPKGGPPLKAVPRDGDWVKENLEALAK